MSSRSSDVIVLASTETGYLSELLIQLCARGVVPKTVLLGSRAERMLAKLNSLSRIRRQLGWLETGRRIVRARRRDSVIPVSAPQPVSDIARQHGFEVKRYPAGNSGPILLELARAQNPTLILAGSGIVESSIIDSATAGCINGHPALLPGLRGVDVVCWALVEGKPVGVTAHYVVPKIDAGSIILSRTVPMVPGETFHAFQARVVSEQAGILAEATNQHIRGTVQARENPTTVELKFAATAATHAEAERKFNEIQANFAKLPHAP